MRDGAYPLAALLPGWPRSTWTAWAAVLAFLAGCTPLFTAPGNSAADIQLASCREGTEEGEVIPIDLDAVLRLTYQGNARIRRGREKARETCEAKDLTSCLCGRKIKAQSRCLQQQLDLASTTTDILRDAGNTYFDLLAARTLEATVRDLEKQRADLVEQARRLAEVEPSARGQLKGLEARAAAQQHALEHLHLQGDSALIKLTYLFGLEGCIQLTALDRQLSPVELVADRPVCSLVDEALAQGPGIQEMRQLVALAESNLGQVGKSCKHLPGGPCGGCQSCFSLLAPFQTCEQLRVAQSKANQARLAYLDLRGKLTAGVRQSYAVLQAGREQLPLLEQTIDKAQDAFTLTRNRFAEHLPSPTATQVSMTLDSLEDAHRAYIETVNTYNKAQLELVLLLGSWHCSGRPVLPRGT